MLWIGDDELFGGHYKSRKGGFHVSCATAIQIIAADGGGKWIALPLFQRASRDHIGMTGKHQYFASITLRAFFDRPQIGHLKVTGTTHYTFSMKAQLF